MLISQKIHNYCIFKRVRRNIPREVVADMLQTVKGSATAEEIWLTLYRKGYQLSESGVYLHLRWLTENGFAGKRSGKGRQAEYYIITK